MKKLYTLFLTFFASICMLNAQNNIAADAADNWVGYMNVFDMSNAYQFGSGWGLPDLKTTLDVTANTITLQPNFNTYADNPGDPYWQNGAIGNKLMEASTYVEPGATFNGVDLTFSGEVVSNTLDATLYTAKYFIKALDPTAGYSDALGGSATFDLPLSGSFSVTVPATSLTTGLIIQYGFMVNGINANPVDEAALGSVVVGAAAPPPSGPACDHTFRMIDSYGDGWNGFGTPLTCAVDIIVDGSTVASGVGLGFTAGTTADEIFSASTGSSITLANWGVGAYDSEVSWEIIDGDGNVVATGAHGDTPTVTGACPPPPVCDHTFRMIDSYGDGWNGFGTPLTCAVDILVDGTPVATGVGLGFTAGSTADEIFSASSGSTITLDNWGVGAYDSEVSWEILDGGGAIIASGAHGDLTGGAGNCPSCSTPSSLTASNITSSDAELGWTAGGTETQWNIEYGSAGYTQGAGTAVNAVTSNPYTLTGLTAGTAYDFYVQADCGGVTGSWAGPFSFNTIGDCFSSGSYDYVENSTLVSSLTSFVANTPGDYITIDFTAGSTEACCDTWYINDAADGSGNTIASGNGSIIGSYESTTGEISFYVISDFSVNGTTFTYSLSCAPPPACIDPTALNVSNVTGTTVDLGWTAGGTETQWNIEYGAAGYTQGAGTAVNAVTTNPYNLSGLTPATTYDFYVQADCGGSGQSNYVGPFSFTTPCNAVSVMPYVQDFDALTPDNAGIFSCITTDNITDCWSNDAANTNNWTARSAATGSGGTGPSADHTGGGNYCFLESSSCYSNSSYLLSVDMDVSSLTSPEMRFWYHMFGGDMGSLTVEVSTDGGTTWSGSLWNQAGDQGDQWREVTVDLASYAGATSIMARFEGITGTGFGSDMAIDDFLIQEKPLCADPLGLTVSAVSTDSAGVSWTAGGTETAWNFEYGAAGYAQGSGTYAGGLTATNYNINGLSPNTSYDVYVQADCGTDSSIWVGPITFTTLIQGASGVTCISGSPGLAFDDDLESNIGWTGDIGTGATGGDWNFDTGGTNSTGTGPAAAHSGSGYIHYEATGPSAGDSAVIVSQAIDLSAGSGSAELSFWFHAYGAGMGDLSVGVSTSATGPFTNVFSYSGQLQTLDTDPWTNVGVDLTAYVGQTIYLELIAVCGPAFTSDMAVDLIQVESCFSCVTPTALTASNISTTQAAISWTAGGSETTWNYVVDTVGFNPYAATNTVIQTFPFDTLNGLTSNTCYELYVQADCGAGDTSAWAGPYSFCTLPDPVCYYLLDMQDSYGDGWNGASIDVSINGIAAGSYQVDQILGGQLDVQQTDTVYAYTGDVVDFSFTSGSWDSEITFQIYDPLGIQLGSYGTNPATGLFLTDSSSNSICAPPNDDLGAIAVTTDISSGCEIDSAYVTMDIYNYGVAAQTGFDVTYSVNASGNQTTETVGGTVNPGDTLSYTFIQAIDVSTDGVYCIDVSTLLSGDLDVSNDELAGAYCVENYLTPDAPTGINDTICEGSGDTLTLTASTNGNITWYDAASGGNVLGSGNTLLTTDNASTTYYAEASANIADTLSTTYAGGNGCGSGNMFDIIATTDLTIDSMRGHFDAADSVKVYYKTGSYLGSEETPGDWTLLGSAFINSSTAAYEALVFSVGQLSLTAGDTVGIYVEGSVRYTNVNAGTSYANADMTIEGGTGLCASFGTTFSPRMWNGTIFYSTGSCVGPRTAVDAIVEDCTNILEIGLEEFSLFPNPNNGNFTIINEGVSEEIDLSITDIQGKVVFSKTLNFNKGEQKALSLENIERGIYLVHLNTDNGRKIINMIIQ